MKHIKGATIVTQFCMENKPIKEFLDDIPNPIDIKELSFEWWQKGVWRSLEIPAYLRMSGLSTIQECSNRIRVLGTFRNKSKEVIIETLDTIGKKYDLKKEYCHITRLIIANGHEQATFKRTMKQIKLPDDKRRKLVVLGLVKKTSDKIIERLSIKKVACQFIKSDKQIVMCSEIK